MRISPCTSDTAKQLTGRGFWSEVKRFCKHPVNWVKDVWSEGWTEGSGTVTKVPNAAKASWGEWDGDSFGESYGDLNEEGMDVAQDEGVGAAKDEEPDVKKEEGTDVAKDEVTDVVTDTETNGQRKKNDDDCFPWFCHHEHHTSYWEGNDWDGTYGGA